MPRFVVVEVKLSFFSMHPYPPLVSRASQLANQPTGIRMLITPPESCPSCVRETFRALKESSRVYHVASRRHGEDAIV